MAGGYDAVIAPFAGGAILPAAYAGARAAPPTVRPLGLRLGTAALGGAPAGAAG